MDNNFNIEEIRKIFQKKFKDRKKIKGISFSTIEKEQKIHKTHKKDLSFKEKITDQAIKNSMRQYSKLKKIIYLNEKKYDEIQKKEEYENKRIKELQDDLNYTNILKLFDIAYNKNNPFKDNGKMVNKIFKVDNRNRVIDKNRKKQIFKNALLKKIGSNIDSGIKKDLDFSEIFHKIENSKKNFEKMLIDKNKKNKNKKINKSKSLILSYYNFNKYNKPTHNENLSEIEYEKNSLLHSTNQIEVPNEIFNDFKEEADKSLESTKYGNIIKENKLRKSSSCFLNTNKNSINISYIQKKKPFLLKKPTSQKLKYFIINNDAHKLNLSQNKLENKKLISNKTLFMNDSIKKYINDFEDIYNKFNKNISNSEKLKIDDKMRNTSSIKNLDEMINIKEEKKSDLLKDKHLKNCIGLPKYKNDLTKKSRLIKIINSIMDDDEL